MDRQVMQGQCSACGAIVGFRVVHGAAVVEPHMGTRDVCAAGSAPMTVKEIARLRETPPAVPSLNLTSFTRRGRVYQRVIKKYRKPRATPREDGSGAWEDPAPEWVWQLAQVILNYTVREADAGEALLWMALAWCERGSDPEERSRRLHPGRPMQDIAYLALLRRILATP